MQQRQQDDLQTYINSRFHAGFPAHNGQIISPLDLLTLVDVNLPIVGPIILGSANQGRIPIDPQLALQFLIAAFNKNDSGFVTCVFIMTNVIDLINPTNPHHDETINIFNTLYNIIIDRIISIRQTDIMTMNFTQVSFIDDALNILATLLRYIEFNSNYMRRLRSNRGIYNLLRTHGLDNLMEITQNRRNELYQNNH
jgi:hypothetical protein